MGRLDGKVAVITGCASGMGLAAAELFLKEGASVMATGRHIENLTEALGELANQNEKLQLRKLDAMIEEDWIAVLKETEEIFGKIDVLVNNAGVSVHNDVVTETLEGWHQGVDNNLTATWLGIKHVIPYMQKCGGGSIVNCGSMSALMGTAGRGAAAYGAAKAGVVALSRTVAAYYGKDNIRVNTVHPGPIYTGAAKRYGCPSVEVLGMSFKDQIPLPPHAGEAIDIANAYLFFASDESKFVTGNELTVDGGWGCR